MNLYLIIRIISDIKWGLFFEKIVILYINIYIIKQFRNLNQIIFEKYSIKKLI
jgi:hypothetical protein